MELIIEKRRKQSVSYPEYIDELSTFIAENILNSTLVAEFAFVIRETVSFSDFDTYIRNSIPSNGDEYELLGLLDGFYVNANNEDQIDNKRGDLLECLVDKLTQNGKYASYFKSRYVTLCIKNSNGKVVFSINPHDIDFYFDGQSGIDSNALDCKIKIWLEDEQVRVFNTLAEKLQNYKMNCSVAIVHLVEDEAWTKKYSRDLPYIKLIGPNKFTSHLL